ncbi:U-box domain-containing protein 4, variant 4 [Dionaea muscipula]
MMKFFGQGLYDSVGLSLLADAMEVSLLKALLNNITFFLSSPEDFDSEPIQKNYQKIEEILKLLKPILGVVVNTELSSNDLLNKASGQLGEAIDELRDLFGNWHPLASRIYLVLQAELLLGRTRTSTLEIFQVLKDLHQLPDELSSASLEHCTQKIKSMRCELTSAVIAEALKDQVGGRGPSSERLTKLADCLGLRSNQEILIEAVALEKMKENAEQAEKNAEVEYIEKLIALVTRMHDRLVLIKQSQSCTPVPIPADFCCPLSLELMTDPVIVASGQTYERAYIRKWLDHGLTVCPKTRQNLGHTNLIPNYTVKALIANWCEINNVKLPDPVKSMSLNQPLVTLPFSDSASLRNLQHSPNSEGIPKPLSESMQPTLLERKNSSLSPRARPEGFAHPNSCFEGDRTNLVGDEKGLNTGRVSPEERLSYPDLGSNSNSNCQPSMPPTDGSIDATSPKEECLRHNRTSSDSSIVSVTNLPQQLAGDANQASDSPAAYSSDGSGELPKEPPAVTPLSIPQREADFPSRLMEIRSRSQTLWRRQSDRLTPRLVSSPTTEMRPDLSGVESQVKKLVEDLKNTSIETLRDASGELRLLAKHNMDNRIVIADCGAINLLVNLLHSTDPKTQENAVTALLNLSINDNNKTAIANSGAIEPLIHVLQTGSPEAKENSAATLFSLSVMEECKIKIGKSGAIEPLVELLGNGTPRGKKDATTALFNLSIFPENKGRIVQAGAVRHLVELMDPSAGMVDKAVAVLSNLATIPEGKTAIYQAGGIPILVDVVELGSARGKENAAAALLQLCTTSSRYCNMVLQEGAVPPLVALSQSGTARGREKAQALLSCFRNQRHGNAGRG